MNSPRNGNRTVKYHLLPLLYERLLIERYFIEERLWKGYVTVNSKYRSITVRFGPVPFILGLYRSIPFPVPFISAHSVPFVVPVRSVPIPLHYTVEQKPPQVSIHSLHCLPKCPPGLPILTLQLMALSGLKNQTDSGETYQGLPPIVKKCLEMK